MKYRLKKDLLWLKAGEIVEIKEADGGKFYLDTSVTHGWIIVSEFPDFFEQINEEKEPKWNHVIVSRDFKTGKQRIFNFLTSGMDYLLVKEEISEDEKDQEAIKRLESRGWEIKKKCTHFSAVWTSKKDYIEVVCGCGYKDKRPYSIDI